MKLRAAKPWQQQSAPADAPVHVSLRFSARRRRRRRRPLSVRPFFLLGSSSLTCRSLSLFNLPLLLRFRIHIHFQAFFPLACAKISPHTNASNCRNRILYLCGERYERISFILFYCSHICCQRPLNMNTQFPWAIVWCNHFVAGSRVRSCAPLVHLDNRIHLRSHFLSLSLSRQLNSVHMLKFHPKKRRPRAIWCTIAEIVYRPTLATATANIPNKEQKSHQKWMKDANSMEQIKGCMDAAVDRRHD